MEAVTVLDKSPSPTEHMNKNVNDNTPPLTCGRKVTLSKNDEICPLAIPNPDLHNINADTKFGENPLKFTQVIIHKWK